MKQKRNGQDNSGFTIIELLTVMSIIVILISVLTPALNRVRRYAMDVKQKVQFHAISIGLESFKSEFDDYPDSNALDDDGKNYCGAMRLAEALVGQDLKGFNPKSQFLRRGFPNTLDVLWDGMPYPPYNTCGVTGGVAGQQCYNDNIKSRKLYLELDNANAYQLKYLFDGGTISSAKWSEDPVTGFDPCSYVLCDSFNRVSNKLTGKKVGMPILYYKADASKLGHPIAGVGSPPIATFPICQYIYNVRDNQALIDMGMPWFPGPAHPLASAGSTDSGAAIADWPKAFYDVTRDSKVVTGDRPYRSESYILISAGFDGQYGTKDDIYNFAQ